MLLLWTRVVARMPMNSDTRGLACMPRSSSVIPLPISLNDDDMAPMPTRKT